MAGPSQKQLIIIGLEVIRIRLHDFVSRFFNIAKVACVRAAMMTGRIKKGKAITDNSNMG